MDDEIENRIRDTLVDALKSYFKSEQVANFDEQTEIEQEDDEISKKMSDQGKIKAEDTSQKNISDPITNSLNPEGEFEEGLTNMDLSNLFQFPDTTAHKSKSFSFSFNIGMKNPQPDTKIPDEIDPKIIDDFMNFMGILGVTPDDIAETIDEMAKIGLPENLNKVNDSMKEIPVEHELFHDVFEEDDHIRVVAEMPGLEKEDIELHVGQKEIELNGTTINLPKPIDPDRVIAKLNNGILEITLHKLAKK